MNSKRFLLGVVILSILLVHLSARGNNELGYIRIGSVSDDPVVSMKTLTSIDIYTDTLMDTIELQFEEITPQVVAQFSDELDLYYAMEPEIWETDEMFQERFDQVEQQLLDAMYYEIERSALDILEEAEQQEISLDGYATKAMANLSRLQTLSKSKLSVDNNGYHRNARIWSLSVSSSDRRAPFTNIPLAIDFTTIGDEKTIKEEIIKFEEAIKGTKLQASGTWHFVRDYTTGRRFLLVVDVLCITNPLAGSTYTATLTEPILLKTYSVKGETIATLLVIESSNDPELGISNLEYRDSLGVSRSLSGVKETVKLGWEVEKGVFVDQVHEAEEYGMEDISISSKEKHEKIRPIPIAPSITQDISFMLPDICTEDEEEVEEKGPIMFNIPLTRLDGTLTSFNDAREGKPAIITYFASWCPPCKQELPHFQKAFDEYGDEISFIFLDALDGQRETLKTINACIKSFPFTGPVFYDEGMFAAIFQTSSLPTTVFLDKDGRVVKGYLGFVPEDVLYADIAALLE